MLLLCITCAVPFQPWMLWSPTGSHPSAAESVVCSQLCLNRAASVRNVFVNSAHKSVRNVASYSAENVPQ